MNFTSRVVISMYFARVFSLQHFEPQDICAPGSIQNRNYEKHPPDSNKQPQINTTDRALAQQSLEQGQEVNRVSLHDMEGQYYGAYTPNMQMYPAQCQVPMHEVHSAPYMQQQYTYIPGHAEAQFQAMQQQLHPFQQHERGAQIGGTWVTDFSRPYVVLSVFW